MQRHLFERRPIHNKKLPTARIRRHGKPKLRWSRELAARLFGGVQAFTRGQPVKNLDHQKRTCLSAKARLAKIFPRRHSVMRLSLIHISEPTRQAEISYAVFCLKKKKKKK